MPAFTPPPGYGRIKVVHSFEELAATTFENGVNALCWPRALPGDFAEVVSQLAVGPGITSIDDARLFSLTLSGAGRIARDILLQDQQRLRACDLAPTLDCINGYTNDPESGPVPTHVQSFHVDSATVAADTWLCTYHGASSEGLRNDQAQRRVDIPETRAELLRLYGGEDNAEFAEYLNDHYYDLHYAPLPGAQPFTFGLHNLWRIVCEYSGAPVPPCIHRAPETVPGQPPRLLLIS
ncbi:MAG TPA: hypothetical protein VD994_18430 [Prosthecobacter sp.]|nr:hypothetical protein [Prosthecobacter sp.]